MNSEQPFIKKTALKLKAEINKRARRTITKISSSKDFSIEKKTAVFLLVGVFLSLSLSAYFLVPYFKSPKSNLLNGNYATAFSQYIDDAKEGNAVAQNVIGNLYLLGLGVKEDKALAARWYLKAALKGYVPAQINLGQIYLNGQGLPRRPLKAMGWFHLARQAGSERADEHIRYMIYSNLILTNMIQEAKLKFDNLKDVNARYVRMGETAFLTKMDASILE